MKRSYKELLSNTAVFAVSNVLSKLLLMLLLPIYTNQLTTEQYGVVELATNISYLVIPFASLAIQDAVFRFTVDNSIEARLVYKNAFWVLAMGVLILLAGSAMVFFYVPLRQWRWWFWGFSTLSMYRNAMSLYAKGTDRTKTFAIDGVLYNAVLAAANIILLCGFKLKVEGYFSAMLIAQGCSILYLYLNVDKPTIGYVFELPLDTDSLRRMLLYSAPLILNSISWSLTHTVDRVMLEAMRSTGDVGIYSAASKIPSLISTVMNIFIQAWTISAIRNFEDGEGKKFYAQVFHYAQMLLVFVTLGVLLINNRIVVMLFGGDFKQAVRYTPVLMLATSALFYSNYFGPVFSSVQKSKVLMLTTLAGMLVNALLNYVFIMYWGIFGACLATLISNVVVSVSRIVLAKRIYTFEIDWALFTLGWLLLLAAFFATLFAGGLAEVILLGIIALALLFYRKNLGGMVQLIKQRIKG